MKSNINAIVVTNENHSIIVIFRSMSERITTLGSALLF